MNRNIKTLMMAVSIMAIGCLAVLSLGIQGTIPNVNGDDGSNVAIKYSGHVKVEKYDAELGTWTTLTDKHNLLVNNGKEYIKKQIGDGTSVATNSTKYISLSNDTTAPDAAWTVIPAEITTNGLDRASATYAANGTGAWNYTYTWTATGSQAVQLTGLNYAETDGSDGNLFAALQFAATSLAVNDQLRVIWSISVS